MPENRTVWVVTAEPEAAQPVRRGLPVRTGPGVAKALEVEALRENLARFLLVLQEILPAEMADMGDFRLEEVEVNAEVTGEGSLMLLGTGVRAAGMGGIKFVLKRVDEDRRA